MMFCVPVIILTRTAENAAVMMTATETGATGGHIRVSKKTLVWKTKNTLVTPG